MAVSSASRRALLLAVAGAGLLAAYVFSFVFAQATPEPHELPVAVAGPASRTLTLQRRIETAGGGSFAVRRLKGTREAQRALREREIYAAVVVGDGPARVLTAPAAGLSATMVAVKELPGLIGAKMPQIEEVRPLAEEDPEGDALNLALFPLVIFGVLLPVLVTLVSGALVVRARIAVLALFTVLGGTGAMAVANLALDALPGSLVAEAGIATLLTFSVAACTTAFIAMLGPPGAGLGLIVFLIVGNVASGASVVNELLPSFFRVVGPYLPPGAGADALRSTAYFDGVALLRPMLVLAGFALAGTLLDLALGGRRPAGQGDPAGPSPDQGPK